MGRGEEKEVKRKRKNHKKMRNDTTMWGYGVGGRSARGEVGGMEISDVERRSKCGDGEWWCGMQSPATPM